MVCPALAAQAEFALRRSQADLSGSCGTSPRCMSHSPGADKSGKAGSMSAYQQKLRAIIDKLRRKTSTGSIEWAQVEGSSAVRTKLKSGIVTLNREAGQDAVRLTVQDSLGWVKLSFDDTAMNLKVGDRWIGYSAEMHELYETAIRLATGDEQVVNELLNELDDEVPF